LQYELASEIANYFPELRARGTGAPAEFNFEVVMEAGTLTKKEPRWHKTEIMDADNIPREVKGFVRDYAVNFNCSVLVKDAKGQTLKTVVITDEKDSFMVAVHRDFLLSANRPSALNTIIGFTSQDQIGTLESAYTYQINRKVELMAAYQAFAKAIRTINLLYRDYEVSKEVFGYGYIKKGDAALTAEIDKLVETYKVALDSMSAGNSTACKSLCSTNITAFQTILASAADKNIKEIVYYNLSHAYVLLGEYAEAWKNYDLFIASGVHRDSRLASELRNRISTYQYYDVLKKKAG
jgi:hypothetical protein